MLGFNNNKFEDKKTVTLYRSALLQRNVSSSVESKYFGGVSRQKSAVAYKRFSRRWRQ